MKRLFYLTASLLAASMLAAVSAAGRQETKEPWDVPPLKDAYKRKFLIGTALDFPPATEKPNTDVAIAMRHFSAFTCSNSMKPDATEPEEGKFTFERGDRMVEAAHKCGATPIGHCLVWHSQTPRWFFQGPDGGLPSRGEALKRMRNHIAGVVGHFKGKVKQWDVVNEALSDAPNEYLRPTPWLRAIGEDYIAEAFRAAHAADPKAILVYNDYNIERSYKRPKAVKLLKSLLDQNVPINAVGLQCHWRMGTVDLADVEESIKEYGALGLKVMVTELDLGVLPTKYQGADVGFRQQMTEEQRAVMNPYTAGLPDDVAQKQAEVYRQAFEMFLRHRNVISRVTFWGTYDAVSWLNFFPIRGRTDYPLLFDRQGNPKPAFTAVVQAAKSTK
jgi:endo-1,4-beta-xylanase